MGLRYVRSPEIVQGSYTLGRGVLQQLKVAARTGDHIVDVTSMSKGHGGTACSVSGRLFFDAGRHSTSRDVVEALQPWARCYSRS